jgi:ubiquinone/menaquinone biosynthesis C-methylase UbiE
MSTNEINKDSWNKHAARYQKGVNFSFDRVDYGNATGLNESDLGLIGNVSGKKVLELGCGGANCGIALAKQGANVTCVDISEQQIQFARENAAREKVEIQFVVSDIEEVNLPEAEYDVVISMAALGYIENIEKAFMKIKKMLKDKGLFVGSLPDAISTCITSRYLWNDPPETHSYFYVGPTKWKWEDEDDFEFVTYRRPISEYINMLTDMGFYIRKVYEFHQPPEKVEKEEDIFRVLYPCMIVMKAINIGSPLNE